LAGAQKKGYLMGRRITEFRQLERLSGGAISLTRPLELEPHRIIGWIEDESDVLELDERQGDLPGQLAAELRRVAKVCNDLADQVDGSRGRRKAVPCARA
jgi:hypothetical protein